ncbi:MAG: cell division protein ZapA [Gemmatimonadaceae bacterium]
MSGKRHAVRVTIAGEEYPIRSDASPEHTRAVARYVDLAVSQVLAKGTVVETHKAAILAALQITDELFKEREATAILADRMSALGDELRPLLPPAKRASGATPEPEDAPPPEGGDGVER